MKKIKYLLFIILILLTINVKAVDSCDSKELVRLKELAKKIEFDYEYKVDGEDVEFTINATNLSKELKVLIIRNYYSGDYREFKGEETGSLGGFMSGEKVVITIKGYVPNDCSGVTVLTKTIKLPYYNWFYDEDRCYGNEGFKYCKLLIDSNITEEEFEKQLNKYIDNEIKKIEEKDAKAEQEEKKESNNRIYIIIGGVLLITALIAVIVVTIIKRRKKNKL